MSHKKVGNVFTGKFGGRGWSRGCQGWRRVGRGPCGRWWARRVEGLKLRHVIGNKREAARVGGKGMGYEAVRR